MVSALSLRLLKTTPPSSENGDSTKIEIESFSGYSADRESLISSPPNATTTTTTTGAAAGGTSSVLLDLRSKQRRISGGDKNTRNKRQKISEQQFIASNVKRDLAKAGRPYPLLVTSRSRIIPNLDMSGIQLVSSKSVSSSPFLYTHEQLMPSNNSNIGNDHNWCDFSADIDSAYKKLIRETAFAYNLKEPADTPFTIESDDYETSTTSSISDTESSETCDTGKDEGITKKKTTMQKVVLNNDMSSNCPISHISMEEAIEVCDSSRLITTATAPYEIIFMNAAFASLTGSSSNNTLGRSIGELLSSSTSSSSLMKMHNTTTVYDLTTAGVIDEKSQQRQSVKCHLKVTPIAPSKEATATITHFAIDFTRLMSPTLSRNSTNECTSHEMVKEGYGAISVVG